MKDAHSQGAELIDGRTHAAAVRAMVHECVADLQSEHRIAPDLATHYVAAELDEGPIIEQDIVRISHAQSASDYVSLGSDVASQILAPTIHAHANHRVFLIGSKTVVFQTSPGSCSSERLG